MCIPPESVRKTVPGSAGLSSGSESSIKSAFMEGGTSHFQSYLEKLKFFEVSIKFPKTLCSFLRRRAILGSFRSPCKQGNIIEKVGCNETGTRTPPLSPPFRRGGGTRPSGRRGTRTPPYQTALPRQKPLLLRTETISLAPPEETVRAGTVICCRNRKLLQGQ